MRRVAGRVAGALSVWAMLSSGVAAETLTDALVRAYNTNPTLEISRAALRAADEEVPQARAGLRPNVDAIGTATLSTNNDRFFGGRDDFTDRETIQLDADWTIFDGGATSAATNAALADVNAQRAALVTAEQNLLLDTITAYMDVRRDLQFVRLAENNVVVIGRQLQAASDRFEVGEVTRTDVSQARARLASSRTNLVTNEGAAERSAETYEAIVGVRPGDLAPPPPTPELPATEEDAIAIAMANEPSLQNLRAQVEASEFRVRQARAAFRPNVSLNGNLTAGNGFEDGAFDGARSSTRDTTVGANVTLPLYRGGALSSAVRQAVANLEQDQAELQDAGRTVSQNVSFAWTNLMVARSSIVSARQEITAARVAFEGIVEEARLGARTTLDVLDTEQDLLNAQSDLVAAQRDEVVAAYTLLSAMGLLTVEHLNLPVDEYNPDAYFRAVENGPYASSRGEVLDRILGRN
ncbi:TolC family outer membrane protein [Pontivivens ytuae]|uniref:Protein CyaE n=1 Tax=Pontivivens ytuae TaxID=2789856 RepID=A0A7S9LSC5_9RHOB|nr:TolC family outer membrane protein [Pontivivens ytuae]QPH54070.1 TolC family outer membrane protein [Pontivivens ytuae]